MKNHITKKTIAIISLALLILITVGTTLALVFTKTGDVENTFKPSRVSCAVVETLVNGDNSTTTETSAGTVSNFTSKSNVQIKNTGDTDAFIRVAVVVNWMNEDGKVWAQKPTLAQKPDATNGQYFIEFNTEDWKRSSTDEYWYYSKPVAPDTLTPKLIETAYLMKDVTPPDGYYLSIEIVASAIQSTPETVVSNQWGIPVSNGELVIPG